MKLVLAYKTVAVGQYAVSFLDNAIQDACIGAACKADVLMNGVSYELDVKFGPTKVELGEADAGIINR